MICLCSASESRAYLLEKFGIEFEQKSVDFNEDQIVTDVAKDFVYLASKGKLQAAEKRYGSDIPLLTADSVIATAEGEILRKPKNREDARRILSLQSGSCISIISSVHFKTKAFLFTNTSATHYHFAKFDVDDLEAYLESELWQGKAGGCMVEGFCKKYIKSVDGYESTAMGLQVEALLPWIEWVKQ
ncbi:septum formation inhibitor Maf [Sulfurovum lithotrophicum]|uniref:Nucleoside triphosphate pyrophosphatase n=1 Tax=Sulfurovum lithotrophicum TaxID=206403 RepID=A0A7U4M2D0_9BACT|nr:septum formation inhibitor Maf [Sulfurovum lithotrophicum]AKF25572.1 septum formation inhibitor Maf [Sulfurovum lithotrophicum]